MVARWVHTPKVVGSSPSPSPASFTHSLGGDYDYYSERAFNKLRTITKIHSQKRFTVRKHFFATKSNRLRKCKFDLTSYGYFQNQKGNEKD